MKIVQDGHVLEKVGLSGRNDGHFAAQGHAEAPFDDQKNKTAVGAQ